MSLSLLNKIRIVLAKNNSYLLTTPQSIFKHVAVIPKNKIGYKLLESLTQLTNSYPTYKKQQSKRIIPYGNQIINSFINQNKQNPYFKLNISSKQHQLLVSDPLIKSYEDYSYIVCDKNGNVWIQPGSYNISQKQDPQKVNNTNNTNIKDINKQIKQQNQFQKEVNKAQYNQQKDIKSNQILQKVIIGAIDIQQQFLFKQKQKTNTKKLSKGIEIMYHQTSNVYFIGLYCKIIAILSLFIIFGMIHYFSLVYDDYNQLIHQKVQKLAKMKGLKNQTKQK